MNEDRPQNLTNGYPWINPIGGLGDQLMLSGVLKQVHDRDQSRKFNLARRTGYLSILQGHPAIASIGFPPKDSEFLPVDYWSQDTLGSGDMRPYQILARIFGLETPLEERLYLPGGLDDDPLLHDFIPWEKPTIIIAPASDSPRKAMPAPIWHHTVEMLLANGAFVMQVGRMNETHIRNAYSVLGLTRPRQVIALVNRADLVITSDNFIMHAAHLLEKPAVVLWGATHHTVYGYPEHIHLQSEKTCELDKWDDCIGPKRNEKGKLYGTPCPEGDGHCMNRFRPEQILEAVNKALLNS